MAKLVKLWNLMKAPASDKALVEALCGFANGDDVVICGQPSSRGQASPRAEMSTWSRWRAAPSEKERKAHVGLLLQVIESGPPRTSPGDTGRRSRDSTFIKLGPRRGPGRQRRMLLPDQYLLGYLAHMDKSVQSLNGLLPRSQGPGFSFAHYLRFENVAAALAYAALLVMWGPYRNVLCRCKLPRCGKFYFAEQNPRGGPLNRTYCDRTHREEHHNSAMRKANSRPRPKAKPVRREK